MVQNVGGILVKFDTIQKNYINFIKDFDGEIGVVKATL